MSTLEVVLGIGFALLGLAYAYRGKRLSAAQNTIKAFEYRAQSAVIESEVKELEKKSRDSSKKADDLLADYHKRFRPDGDGGNKPN